MRAGPHDRHGPSAALVAAAVLLAAAGCGDGERRAGPSREATTPPPPTPPTTAAAPLTPGPRVAWTRDELLRRLTGRRIRVAGRAVRIEADTLVCRGVGPAATRSGGEPAWTRFRCLQPTFPRGAVAGPDAIFTVEPVGPRAFRVVGGRLTSY